MDKKLPRRKPNVDKVEYNKVPRTSTESTTKELPKRKPNVDKGPFNKKDK